MHFDLVIMVIGELLLIACFLGLTVPTFCRHSCLMRVDYEGVQVVGERNLVAE